MVHRYLQQKLEGKPPQNTDINERCEHVSVKERSALEAERASLDYKQAEYMSNYIGNTFEGLISGLMDWGFFVQLIDNKCEGAVKLHSLEDDFYELDEEEFALIGRSSGRAFYLGDKVQVTVKNVDLVRKNIDFVLAN
jgi:ribonuclease R